MRKFGPCEHKFKRHHVALLQHSRHDKIIAIVALSITDKRNAIGIMDPVQHDHPRHLSYETEAIAERTFTQLVTASVAHGSRLIYHGPRNSG